MAIFSKLEDIFGLCCWIALLTILQACARYHELPLDRSAVDRALEPPSMETIRVEAEEIEPPILRPVEIDLQNGLSPDEAAVVAVLANPKVRAARDKRGVAQAQLLQAGILPNPQFSYSLEVPTGGSTQGTVNAFGLGLSWDIQSLITHGARVEEARAQAASVDLEVAWQEWQIAQAAKDNIYQLVTLERRVALAAETEQRLTKDLDLVRKAVANGTRTAKDLSATQVAGRQASAVLLDLKKQAGQLRLQLKGLLGLPPGAQARLQGGIELPSRFELPSAQELIGGVEQRRLDLVALRRGYESREAAVRAAVLDQFPKVGIGPTIGRDIENVDTVGFGLTIELPIFNRNQGRIAVERATRQKMFDEYVNRVFEARSDIERIHARILFLNQQIAAAQAAEPDLHKLVEDYRIALAAGRTDALTYYAAWNDLASSRMKTLALKGQLAGAIVALELAAGMYRIPEEKESTAAPAAHSEAAP
jgi:cobalt-zinc-cadmium efflux system outer membrane protein